MLCTVGREAAPYFISFGNWDLGPDFVLSVHILASGIAIREKLKLQGPGQF